MNQPLRICLLGAGYIADWHSKAIASRRLAKVTAVCDRDAFRAKAHAARLGAKTVLVACVAESERATPPAIDDTIRLECGPEVLTGSTRLKAGTATKLARERARSSCTCAIGCASVACP